MYGEGSFGVMTFRDATGRNAALGPWVLLCSFPLGDAVALLTSLV